MTSRHAEPRNPRVLLTGVGILLALVLVRTQASFDPFPSWSGDPTVLGSPVIAITPAISLWLDAATCFVGALLLIGGIPATSRPRIIAVVALGLGAAAAAIGWPTGRPASFDDSIAGATWASAMIAAVALHAACAYPAARRLCLATLFGAIGAACAKGAVQVFVEHPASVRMFIETKRQFFDAQGWTEGSPMARAYERRVMQAEATGWFGISNILATFGAAGGVFFGALITSALRREHRESRAHSALEWTGLALGFVASVATLVLTKSKGGAVAALVGLGVLVLSRALAGFAPRALGLFSRHAGALAMGASLLAIAARGAIGERISELSLLFRWYYMQGAARIFADSPRGVGAAGFKDAYLSHKNPLSPEDVASPHSIFADWLTTLGVAGLGWCVLWAIWICRAGRGISEDHADDRGDDRSIARAAFLVLAVAALFGAFIEQAAATPEGLLVRFAAIFGGGIIAIGVSRGVTLKGAGLAAACAACTLGAHAQIELTPTAPSSCAWFLCLCAVLAPTIVRAPAGKASLSLAGYSCLVATVLAGIVSGGIGSIAGTATKWERELTSAARAVEMLPEFKARRDALASGRAAAPGDTTTKLLTDLCAATGAAQPAPGTGIGQAIDAQIVELRRRALGQAREHLSTAADIAPTHFETLRALSRVDLEFAALSARSGPLPPDAGVEARLEKFAREHRKATAWSWLAVLRQTRWEQDRSPATLGGVMTAWGRAREAAPFDPLFAAKAAFAAAAAGDAPTAAQWAAEALKLNEQMRLDPLRQFAETEREALRKLAAGG